MQRKRARFGSQGNRSYFDLLLRQNSDACERLFTETVADLLDTYIPGFQETSLYIRIVFHLLEPFRKPKFGLPSDVQQSFSCGITILLLWGKVAELIRNFVSI